MKRFLPLLLYMLSLSCSKEKKAYSVVIYDENTINTTFLQNADEAEKALLSGYLVAYANECSSEKESVKCKILQLLSIKEECDTKHISNLKNWFSEDIMVKIKLQNCPNLPKEGAIQNIIKRIELQRNADTISIRFHVKGFNNRQEKGWNIDQTHNYIIKNNKFIIIK